MKRTNKKGFTLMEVIAVIIILGLLIMIAVPAVNKQLSNFRINYYDKLESSVKAAGEDYVADKRYAKPTKLLYSKVIKISELEDEGYIDEVKDYLGNKCDSKDTSYSYVVVVKTGEKEYQYQACLRCSEDEYATNTNDKKYNLCDAAWLDNTGIEYVKPGISSDLLYVYYGTTEQEIKEQVGITYDIVKRDRNGEVLAQVENSEAEEDDILYPQNIGELVGKNVNSIVELRYVLPDGETLTRRAVIYKHNDPKVTMTYGNANTVTNKKVGDKYNNGSNEWASKLNIKIEFSPSDIKEITDKINMKTAEYYDPATNKWVDTNCSLSSDKKSCTWTVASNFNKSVKIRVVNQNDRRGDGIKEHSIKVDITKPTCASNNGSTTWAKSRTVTESCTDSGGSGCNKGSYPITYPTSSVKNKKTDNITIYDNAGNSQSCPVNIYVDSTPPSSCDVTLHGVSNNGTTSSDITIDVKGVDNETDASGIKSETVDVKLNGSSLGDIRNTSGKNNGKYTVVGTCTDKAGNSKTSATQTFTLSKKVTISYNAGVGGSGSMASTTCGYNENCNISGNSFTRTGYHFTGWKNGSASYLAGGTYKFTSNVTLTAQWAPNTYTINFNGNGANGGATGAVTCTYDQNCTLPGNGFSRTGYRFIGWGLSTGDGVVYNNGATVNNLVASGSITLYAKWSVYKVHIRYNTNGGSILSSNASGRWSTSGNNVYLNGALYEETIDYGSRMGSSGLSNWNNSGYIYITRPSYTAVPGQEWVCNSGCSSTGRKFSQDVVYSASDFCNAANGDCTVTVGVNWQVACGPVYLSAVSTGGNNGGYCWNNCMGKSCQDYRITFSISGCNSGMYGHVCYYNPAGYGISCNVFQATYPTHNSGYGVVCFNSSTNWTYDRSTEWGYGYVCNQANQCAEKIAP